MQSLDNHLISDAHWLPYFICPSDSGLLLINKLCQGGFHLWDIVAFPLFEKYFTPNRGLIYSLILFKFTLLLPYKRGHPNLTDNISAFHILYPALLSFTALIIDWFLCHPMFFPIW